MGTGRILEFGDTSVEGVLLGCIRGVGQGTLALVPLRTGSVCSNELKKNERDENKVNRFNNENE